MNVLTRIRAIRIAYQWLQFDESDFRKRWVITLSDAKPDETVNYLQ